MKQLLIILFLAESLFIFGQKKPEGTFCNKASYSRSKKCFTFKSDSLFTLESSACRTKGVGRGKYKIVNNNLIFTFIDSDTANNSIAIKKINCESPDSITLNIHMKEFETNFPMKMGMWFSKGDRVSRTYYTDSLGNCIIKLNKAKTDKELNLTTRVSGLKNHINFKINTDDCQDISIILDTSNINYYQNGTVWSYRIIRKTKNKIKLKRDHYKTKLKRNRN